MNTVIVKFNRPSTMGLTATDTNNAGYTEFNLKPGVNEVPKEIWERHENHPIIKAMLDEGDLEIGESKTVNDYLLTLNAAHAIDAVKKTINIDILQAWGAREKRKPVMKAIDKQLKDLKAPPVYRNREQTMEEKLEEARTANLDPDDTGDEE